MRKIVSSALATVLSVSFLGADMLPAGAASLYVPQASAAQSDIVPVVDRPSHSGNRVYLPKKRDYRRHHSRDRARYWRGHRGYDHYRPGYRRHGDLWFPLAAFAAGAIISGAIADRARFGSWMIFAFFFATIDYFAVAGWVWNTNGWIFNLGTTLGFSTEVIDYAGGTAVHINAGAAALALALVLGKRVGFQKGIHKPHNVPLVMLGAAILWFGWFGFNAGAAAFYAAPEGTTGDILSGIAGVGSPAGLIVLNTLGATAAAILGWAIVEKLKDGKPTAVGAASGAVAGLVAITPSCANLAPGWALLLGIIAGAVCALAVELKWRLGFDDSLDVVGVHLVGGLIGTLFLGFFATGTGLFLGGNAEQLILQAIAAVTVLIFSFVVAYVLGFIIEKTIGFRVKNEDEVAGIDTAVHGEEGYALVD